MGRAEVVGREGGRNGGQDSTWSIGHSLECGWIHLHIVRESRYSIITCSYIRNQKNCGCKWKHLYLRRKNIYIFFAAWATTSFNQLLAHEHRLGKHAAYWLCFKVCVIDMFHCWLWTKLLSFSKKDQCQYTLKNTSSQLHLPETLVSKLRTNKCEELTKGVLCADPLTRHAVWCEQGVIVCSFEVHVHVLVLWLELWEAERPKTLTDSRLTGVFDGRSG